MDKGLVLNNNKPTTYKEAMMGPDSVKMVSAMKSKIGEYFLKVNGSIKLMDLDGISLKKLDLSKVCLRQGSKS